MDERQAKEHSSPEALKQYLKDHPKADPSKHTVKKKDDGKGKKEKKEKPKGIQRPSEDKVYKGRPKDVTKWTQSQHSEVVNELSKRPADELQSKVWLIETEEQGALRNKDSKKVQELALKKLHFEKALSRKKEKKASEVVGLNPRLAFDLLLDTDLEDLAHRDPKLAMSLLLEDKD